MKCKSCNKNKNQAEFYFKYTKKDGTKKYHNSCKSCICTKSLKRYSDLSPKQKELRHKRSSELTRNKPLSVRKGYRLRHRFGIEYSTFEEWLKEQNYKCYICHEAIDENSARVDHNHTTGKIRKLLCNGCNVVLGHSREKISVLENCIRYIRECN